MVFWIKIKIRNYISHCTLAVHLLLKAMCVTGTHTLHSIAVLYSFKLGHETIYSTDSTWAYAQL